MSVVKQLFFGIFILFFTATNTYAVSDAANNKFGINILSPESDIEDASRLVNTNGDWGWVVLTIRNNERDLERWQSVFDELNKKHLIPIVRIATNVKDGIWSRPDETEAKAWADFLDKLHWPVKNRYVQAYNEVNRSSEWGGSVDPYEYAKELDKTINHLKDKNPDFFVLNAPLDLALGTTDSSLEAYSFLMQMEESVPGIFKKIDGWASHSYPNPDFSADPADSGRTSLRGYVWELNSIDSFTDGKNLPVFITETGWKRGSLDEEQIAAYFRFAFQNVWNDDNVMTVAPFVLSYYDSLFAVFSFREPSGSFYQYFDEIRNLEKNEGKPKRDNTASILELKAPETVIVDSPYRIKVAIRNSGNHIWDTANGFDIRLEGEFIEVAKIQIDEYKEIYPGKEVEATIHFSTQQDGAIPANLKIFDGDMQVAEKQIDFTSKNYLAYVFGLITSAI